MLFSLQRNACCTERFNNQSDSELLQKDLTNLENWEKTWQMKFKPEKCYVIHVTKKKIPLKLNYKLHYHTLQPVDNSKYLDVTISNDLDWGPHINNINVTRAIGDTLTK
jgi:hypothetical protein